MKRRFALLCCLPLEARTSCSEKHPLVKKLNFHSSASDVSRPLPQNVKLMFTRRARCGAVPSSTESPQHCIRREGWSGKAFLWTGLSRMRRSGGVVRTLLEWWAEPHHFGLGLVWIFCVWRERRGRQTEITLFDRLPGERLSGFCRICCWLFLRPRLGSSRQTCRCMKTCTRLHCCPFQTSLSQGAAFGVAFCPTLTNWRTNAHVQA